MSMIPDQIHRADKQTLQLIFHVDHLVGVWRHLYDDVNVAVTGRLVPSGGSKYADPKDSELGRQIIFVAA